MFLIIKINAKVLTQLQTNTNPTKTTDEKTRELLCLLPQKITENLLQNKLPRPSDKEPPNINTPPARTKWGGGTATEIPWWWWFDVGRVRRLEK